MSCPVSIIRKGSESGRPILLIPLYDLVVFLVVPTEVRPERLREREFLRYGDAIRPDGSLYVSHIEFLEWAARYDDAPATMRSLAAHRAWLEMVTCPVLELQGDSPLEELLGTVKRRAVNRTQHG